MLLPAKRIVIDTTFGLSVSGMNWRRLS